MRESGCGAGTQSESTMENKETDLHESPEAVGGLLHRCLSVGLWFIQYIFFVAGNVLPFTKSRTSPYSRQWKQNLKFESTIDETLSKIASNVSAQKGTLIFYGTQSGTAKNFALALSHELSRALMNTAVCDPSEYNMGYFVKMVKDYGDSITVGFFIATYGEGGPTDNFSMFFDQIMGIEGPEKGTIDPGTGEELKPPLEKLRYYILGLGNSTYRDYNGASKSFDAQLIKLGAKRLGEFGLVDECRKEDNFFITWQNEIIGILLKESGIRIDSEEYKFRFRERPHECPFSIAPPKLLRSSKEQRIFRGSRPPSKEWRWTESPEKGGYYEDLRSARNVSAYPHTRHRPLYAKVKSSELMFTDTYDLFEFEDKSLPWGGPPLDSLGIDAEYNNGVLKVERQCIRIDLDLSYVVNGTYSTGDHIYIFPKNDPYEVQRLINALGWNDNKDTPVEIVKSDDASYYPEKRSIPWPFTPSAAIEHYFDIAVPISRERLDIIARYANDKMVAKELFDISEDYEKYNKFILSPRRNLADVLIDFGCSFSVPMEVVLGELLDEITPRPYSIASSNLEEPTTISIVAVVVRYATYCPPLGISPGYVRTRAGLTTSWMLRAHKNKLFTVVKGPNTITDGEFPSSYIPCFTRMSGMYLPKNHTAPVIMVGPGTGVAPFRAFVRERFLLAKNGTTVGSTILFYGCRSKNCHLYKDEFDQLLTNKPPSLDLEIFSAYSRSPDSPKKYVTDHMLEQKHKIWTLLNDHKGVLYICGESKSTCVSVKNTIQNIYLELSPSASESGNYISILSAEDRYCEDLW